MALAKPKKTRAKKAPAEHVCAMCKTAKSAPRRPGGWKETPSGLLCDSCIHKAYVIRAIVLPIAECIGVPWADFNDTIRKSWSMCTDLSNWLSLEMLKHDEIPTVKPGIKTKLAPFHKGWYSYGHVVDHYPYLSDWDGAKGNMALVARSTERKYLQQRFNVLVKRDVSMATQKYPTPIPIGADDWTPSYHGGNKTPHVLLRIPGGAVTVRLERKADFGRQLGQFDQVISGKAVKAEAAIYRHKRTGKLLLKMVVWLPKSPLVGARTNACLLYTDPNALLVAEVKGRQPWILNCDHLKKWLQVREVYLQRTGEDLKREKRADPKQKRGLLKSRQARLDKIRNRINTALETASAQVAKFCERQDVGTVVYDDLCRTFATRLPWYELAEMLKRKLAERGIEFHERSETATASGISDPAGD